MGWIISLFFAIYYFVSKDSGAAIACGLFGIAGAIEILSTTVEKFAKAQGFVSTFFDYVKSLGNNKEERS